jgi:hypothetical protein
MAAQHWGTLCIRGSGRLPGWRVQIGQTEEGMSSGDAQARRYQGGLTDEMSPEVGKLVNLRVMKLEANPALFDLPDSISCLQRLELLHIDGCPMHKLPQGFGALANLKTLRLIYTAGTKFPSDLKVRDPRHERIRSLLTVECYWEVQYGKQTQWCLRSPWGIQDTFWEIQVPPFYGQSARLQRLADTPQCNLYSIGKDSAYTTTHLYLGMVQSYSNA